MSGPTLHLGEKRLIKKDKKSEVSLCEPTQKSTLLKCAITFIVLWFFQSYNFPVLQFQSFKYYLVMLSKLKNRSWCYTFYPEA